MKFGIIFFASTEDALQHDSKYHLIIECARFADQHGFSSVWVPERHFTKFGCLYPNPSVLHAALARETRHIRLQAGSVVVPLHNPIRIAEEWAMVDNLSGGRVGLSFASGWNPDDFALFPDRYQNRHEEMYAGIRKVQQLWRGEPVWEKSGTGKNVAIRTYPTPVQPELPVWITAAANPDTFVRAGQLGANLLTHTLDHDTAQLAAKINLYRKARQENGFDPRAGQVTLLIHTYIGQNGEEAREQAREPYCRYIKSNIGLFKGLAHSRGQDLDFSTMPASDLDQFVQFIYERFATEKGLIGTPQSCIPLVRELEAAGVDELACLLDFGPDAGSILRNLPYLDELKNQYGALPPVIARRQDTARPAVGSSLNGGGVTLDAKPGEVTTGQWVEQVKDRCRQEISGADFYAGLAGSGIQLQGCFRGVETVWRRDGEALGQLRLPPELLADSGRYAYHPAFLDACFQVFGATLPQPAPGNANPVTYMPTGFDRLEMHSPALPPSIRSHAVQRPGAGIPGVLVGDVSITDASGKVIAEVQGLRCKRMAHAATEAARETFPGDTLYALAWEVSRPTVTGIIDDASPDWVLLGEAAGLGNTLERLLAERGQGCHRIPLAPHGHEGTPAGWEEHLLRLLGSSRVLKKSYRIVSLQAIDEGDAPDGCPAASERITAFGLRLVQLLAGYEEEASVRVWFVTRGAQTLPGQQHPVSVQQAPLWGLGRVVAVEHAKVWGGLIELDPAYPAAMAAEPLWKAIGQAGKEDQLMLRDGQVYSPRLRRAVLPVPANPPASFPAGETYLVTGGLGGLGLLVARWLAKSGANSIVLCGRSAPSAAALEVASELSGQGVAVKIVQADVASEEEVAQLIGQVDEAGPPLRGIFHLAGILDEALLSRQDREKFRSAGRPKINGAWNLHYLTRDKDLRYFVLFSSLSSLIALPGQASYAAANSFLDALAQLRKAQGKPVNTINWGPWAEVGHAATEYGRKAHENLFHLGIKPLSPEDGLALMDGIIRQQVAHLFVAAVDWQRMQAANPVIAQSTVLEALLAQQTSRPVPQAYRLVEELTGIAGGKRQPFLESHIQTIVKQLLKLEPAGEVDSGRGFTDLGMDSLMALELRNRLQKNSGCALSATITFKYPTIKSLSEYMLVELFPAKPAPVFQTDAAVADHSDVRELSDDQLAALIDKEISDLIP